MAKIKQNNLAEATTDLGFVRAINENLGDGSIALSKQVEIDGKMYTVEGVTPEKLMSVIQGSTFKTPRRNLRYVWC